MEDIEKIMALGYNGVRKHQKTEDERFLYWCDVKGLLVWSEFPATYVFNDDAVENVMREWTEIVRQNYNHPAIITWTPFNESWGIPDIAEDKRQQRFTEAIYSLTKSIDRCARSSATTAGGTPSPTSSRCTTMRRAAKSSSRTTRKTTRRCSKTRCRTA